MSNMKDRRDPRFDASETVWITIFGEPDIQLPARVKNVSGRGIGLELDGPVAPGSALKLELDDHLLLGEVIYCRQDGEAYYVGVELEQVLAGLAALGIAVRGFEEEVAGGIGGEESGERVRKDRRRR